MTHNKNKRFIAIVPIIILIYLAVTLLLYNIFLDPSINKITGNVLSRVNVTRPAVSICDFDLKTGKNHISFHCVNGIFPKDYFLDNITDEYTAIFSYNKNDPDNLWKSYNPGLPGWVVQDLEWINGHDGYWLMMKNDKSFAREGFFNTESQVQLYSGWNLIGYPRANSSSPQEAYSSLDGNYDYVLHYDASNLKWDYYVPGDNSSTLVLIEPEKGYWIHLTADDIWVYP